MTTQAPKVHDLCNRVQKGIPSPQVQLLASCSNFVSGTAVVVTLAVRDIRRPRTALILSASNSRRFDWDYADQAGDSDFLDGVLAERRIKPVSSSRCSPGNSAVKGAIVPSCKQGARVRRRQSSSQSAPRASPFMLCAPRGQCDIAICSVRGRAIILGSTEPVIIDATKEDVNEDDRDSAML
ncbi:hypothetical protein V1522DRAFT_422923 [Lipomyces starkeyi]